MGEGVVVESAGAAMEEQRADQICEQCHSGAHEKSMLLCDRCNRGWHLYCLSPPLSAIPHGNWYCLECLASENESFGFAQGRDHSYESFQRFAERFRRKWFASRISPPSNCDVERDFWRIVERATDPVEVLYGSDIDTGHYGSGFPREKDEVPRGVEAEEWGKYVRDPWNLNNFPKLEESMLRMVQDDIPGVIVPWLYMGMLFSSFCWHYEDHCFYSINYLHRGAPKTWYSVPGSAASEFEEVMQKSFPDLFEAQPDLLFQLVTMLNPTVLRDSGVPVCTTTQEAGNFVITFPRSYHGGFNHGFNCAEAVNFAPADWLAFGSFAVERYRFYHKAAVLSQDELLCVVAKNKVSAVSKPFVVKELVGIVKKERAQREQLWASGVAKSSRMKPRECENHISTEEDPMCIICRYYLHLSAVVCSCRPSKAVCLQHARQLCECPVEQQRLLYRYSLAELEDLVHVFEGREKEKEVAEGESKVMGRMVRHTELAERWVERVERASHTTATYEFLESVLEDAEQFLWGGHEMDSVRVVERKLASARRWADEVARCSTSIRERRVPKVGFGVVERLVGAEPVPCAEPHLAHLKVVLESAKLMREKITDFRLTEPLVQRASLEALIEEARRFCVGFEELSRLEELVKSAEAWSERVRKLLPPIKALRSRKLASVEELASLQEQSSTLPVRAEDREILDLVILRAGALEQKVSATLGSKLALEELERVLEEVQDLPVQVAGLAELEQGVADGRAWAVRVRTTLGMVHLYEYETSVALLRDLLTSTSKLCVESADVKAVESALKKVEWLGSASKVLGEVPSTRKLGELLDEASRLELRDEKLVLEMQELADSAVSWESKAAHALKEGDSYANVEELLGCAGSIKVRLEGLGALKELFGVASRWKERAEAYMSRRRDGKEGSGSRLALSGLQVLVAEAEQLRLNVEESRLLATYLADAEGWVSRVGAVTASVGAALEYSGGSDSREMWDGEGRRAVVRGLEEQMAKVQGAVEEGVELGLDLAGMSELESLSNVIAWSMRAMHVLERRPVLEVAKALLKEGSSLCPRTRAWVVVRQAIGRAESWKQVVEMVVPSYGKAKSCSRQQLEQLLREAKSLMISVANEEGYIQDALSFHSLWQNQVHQALITNRGCLTRQELLSLQEDSAASWVESDEKRQISAIVSDVDMWLSRCRDAIAAPNADPSMPLKDMLSRMHLSVVRALQRVEGEELNCVCGEMLHKADASMLHCDTCDDWYHPTCLGLLPFQTRVQKQYICPYCSALSSGVLFLHEDAYSEVHVTRRPSSAVIVEFLKSARSIACRMEEVMIMEALMSRLEDWRHLLRDILEPALVLRSHRTVVDVCSLLRALKAVEGMEVQEDSSYRVKLAIRANAWRNRAMILLDGAVKPSLRYVSKSIKEAAAVSVTDEDCVLRDLKVAEARAVHWMNCTNQVIGDRGRASLEDVAGLMEEGERLAVSVPDELMEGLRARSELYCVCRKPYDQDEAMIACDHCSEWYHYSCLGLAEPESERSGGGWPGQQDGAEFVCPDCEQAQDVGVREPGRDVGAACDERKTGGKECSSEAPPAPVTPDAPKEVEVVAAGLRGKRSSRAKTKSVVRSKWQQSHVLTSNEQTSSSSSEAETPTSGRPCRRTAGRHSGFENYVLLMRSR
ncbi:hypothetical protein KC19_8G068600 [Ceratodon purpureus]|uniref:Uncharacterized protein n=1 Tax=Ceratodon purpureus TaxID=3225 RepID=A0A8T0GZD0_CERPU|nr:hypothetical protein KC19_8G068600 [Ceratodon purpureus]